MGSAGRVSGSRGRDRRARAIRPVNPAGVHWFGGSPQGLVGQPAREVFRFLGGWDDVASVLDARSTLQTGRRWVRRGGDGYVPIRLTAAPRTALADLGGELGQGFLWSPPRPGPDAGAWAWGQALVPAAG